MFWFETILKSSFCHLDASRRSVTTQMVMFWIVTFSLHVCCQLQMRWGECDDVVSGFCSIQTSIYIITYVEQHQIIGNKRRRTLFVIENSSNNPNACIISYEDLLNSHSSTTEKICQKLNIQILKKPDLPSKNENVVTGAKIDLKTDDAKRLQDYCNERIEEYPVLKTYLRQ